MLDESVVPGPLLQYKNTSRLARGDDVTTLSIFIHTETHQDAARTHSQAYVVETAQDGRRIRFWVARGVSWISEVKNLGRSPLQGSRALSNFANGTSSSVVLNALSRMEWIVL